MTKDEAIKKLIQEVKLIANCGSVEDFTVAGIRCTLRDALYRYNQMSDQPTLREIAEQLKWDVYWRECSLCGDIDRDSLGKALERAMLMAFKASGLLDSEMPEFLERLRAELLKAGAKHL